jgi:hypothetical protein
VSIPTPARSSGSKPFSVDGHSPQPYRELLEGLREHRIALRRYWILRRELRELETIGPGLAPDHPLTPTGSKDVADGVAGAIGYLAAFGHAELTPSGRWLIGLRLSATTAWPRPSSSASRTTTSSSAPANRPGSGWNRPPWTPVFLRTRRRLAPGSGYRVAWNSIAKVALLPLPRRERRDTGVRRLNGDRGARR